MVQGIDHLLLPSKQKIMSSIPTTIKNRKCHRKKGILIIRAELQRNTPFSCTDMTSYTTVLSYNLKTK
jgi:hypothetical protein